MSQFPVPVAPYDPKVDRLERELSKRINQLELQISELREDLWHKRFNLELKIDEVRSDLRDYEFKTEIKMHFNWTMALGLAILIGLGQPSSLRLRDSDNHPFGLLALRGSRRPGRRSV